MQCNSGISIIGDSLRELSAAEILLVGGGYNPDGPAIPGVRSHWWASVSRGFNSALDGAGRGALIGGTLGAALGGPPTAALGAAAGAVYGAGMVILVQ
ncbi:hypothetical protein [Burkholderia guangdongensis]|uniref:hypothetical protein n=1 Tax=Burkholderia guangdongensis TaxID=1792500 RepID=UPI0015CAC421|nr:hypothetical protein [Burkholderia guangdongensis]